MEYSEVLSLPTPAERDYYKFGGWYCKYDSNTYAAGQSISGSKFDDLSDGEKIKFVAQWDLTKYKVSYDFNGGKGTEPAPITVSVNDNVQLANAPTRDGYTFIGWESSVDYEIYAAKETKKNWANSTDKNVTFTAQWKKNDSAQ